MSQSQLEKLFVCIDCGRKTAQRKAHTFYNYAKRKVEVIGYYYYCPECGAEYTLSSKEN